MFADYELIDALASRCLLYSLCKDIEEYKDINYEDCNKLYNALCTARSLIEDNEVQEFERIFSDGEFKEKNAAFLKLYKAYMKEYSEKELLTFLEGDFSGDDKDDLIIIYRESKYSNKLIYLVK